VEDEHINLASAVGEPQSQLLDSFQVLLNECVVVLVSLEQHGDPVVFLLGGHELEREEVLLVREFPVLLADVALEFLQDGDAAVECALHVLVILEGGIRVDGHQDLQHYLEADCRVFSF